MNVIRACHELGALRMVADLSLERLDAVRQAFPEIQTTTDVQAIMRGPADAVAIATSAPSHVALALEAMHNGKDVFVEKPLALGIDDARLVAATAERLGRKVFVGHVLLYHPAITALKSLLDAGTIGKITHLRSRRLGPGRIRTNEDVWWSFAPHDVAMMLDLLGEPLAVSAAGYAAVQDGIADFMYADFAFSDARSAHIEVCWLDPDKSSRLDVFGTAGIASVETARSEATLTHRTFATGAPAAGILPAAFGEPVTVGFPNANPLQCELRSFFDWIGGGPTPPTDVRHGVRVVQTLAAAHEAGRAARRCEPVRRFAAVV